MRTSLKLGLLLAASGSIAYVGCSSSSGDDSSSPGGSTSQAGTGVTGHAGTASGGTSTGGTASAGTSAGGASAGTGGASAGASSGGASGSGGAGAGTGGAGAGSGGASAGSGGAAAGSGGASAGTGGATGGAACADETTGVTGDGEAGAGGAPDTVTTAIVLVDDVVVKDAANTNVLFQWQFPDATTIADTSTARPGDKWSRTAYSSIGATQTPSDTFLACDGNPANGSIKNIIPFTADSQYYQLSVLFAPADYSNYHITAKVKLVSGGRPVAACEAGALLYAVDGAPGYAMTPLPAFTTLVAGQWKDISLTIPATGFTNIDELAVQISTYPCN